MPRFKGDGTGDLFVRIRVVLPTDLSDEAKAAAGAPRRPHRPARPAGLTRSHERDHTMQLDRFTEKAQEAIVAAQTLAGRLQSPVLDAEHLLSALIEPDDGVPAETLRRLGVDLPGVPRRARRGPRQAGARSRAARSRSTRARSA